MEKQKYCTFSICFLLQPMISVKHAKMFRRMINLTGTMSNFNKTLLKRLRLNHAYGQLVAYFSADRRTDGYVEFYGFYLNHQ